MANIYKVKRFSFWGKTKAGLKGFGKGAKYGALAGSVLAPGNLTLALLGKKKAAALVTVAGAGLGAGIGGYLGAKESINSYNYEERLKNDPEFRAKVETENKKELEEYIKYCLEWSPDDPSVTKKYLKKFEKEFNVSFKNDLYSYVDFYNKFYKKNFKKWHNVLYNLKSRYDYFVEDFDSIFPAPSINKYTYKYRVDEYLEEDNNCCLICGGDSSDHYFLYYHFDEKYYDFPLGFGYDSEKISECIGKFTKQWKTDLNKIKKPEILEVAKVHNQIIDEFLNGIKIIK